MWILERAVNFLNLKPSEHFPGIAVKVKQFGGIINNIKF